MFSSPEENLKQFEIGPHMVVADLGAGTGFYTIPLAKMVPKGKVYAIEVLPELVATMRNKVKDNHLQNVECLLGNVEKVGGTKLGDASIDRAVASNILFQVEHKENFVAEVSRILSPGGKVLLIDWSQGGTLGPRDDFVVTKDKAQELFLAKGFVFEKDINAGEYHYGMILTRG